MREFSIADESMEEILIENTKKNFNETGLSTKYFFKTEVDFKNLLICKEDGVIASQLYMFPIKMRRGKGIILGNYIYSASTLQEYRGKGCMTGLLDYAFKVAQERGQVFSLLRPANDKLFDFYKKSGYFKFHTYKKIIFTSEEMGKFKGSGDATTDIDLKKANKIRKKFLNQDGEIIWDLGSFHYAFAMNKNLNGVNIMNKHGYAITFLSKKNEIFVIELAADKQENIASILGDIYNIYGKRTSYIVRLPERCKIFEEELKKQGETVSNTMLRPIGEGNKRELLDFFENTVSALPCMGFTLE